MSINDKIMNKFTIYDKLIVLSFILAITLSIATVNGLTPVFGEITANTTNSHNIQVEVGGGNITYPLFGYNPKKYKFMLEIVYLGQVYPKWRSLIQ